MLERFEQIQGIGLLHDARGAAHKCAKLTLIYADNGRGKSTLAAILRSLATADPAPIQDYKTIAGTHNPKAVLQFDNGHKLTFAAGSWSKARPEILVFDTAFIAKNVYSGSAVNTDHRRHLLEFVLGEAAVSARNAVDMATQAAATASDQERACATRLSALHTSITLAEFEALQQTPNADAQIVTLEAHIAAARDTATIRARPAPQPIAEPAFDIEELFTVLGTSLANVHEDAEALVRSHIAKLGAAGAESWLGQGAHFAKGDDCPYCGQNVTAVELVQAYQTHFDDSYRNLKTKISALASSVPAATVTDSFAARAGTAAAQADLWRPLVQLPTITFDASAAQASLSQLHDQTSALLQHKLAAPAEPIGSEQQKGEVARLWAEVLAPMRATNAAISAAGAAITTYKAQLDAADVHQLTEALQRAQASKRRYEPGTLTLLNDLQSARQAAQNARAVQQAARASLDALMAMTLGTYQQTINEVLAKFAASFRIENMSANFRGNAPRSEYGLLVRDQPVHLDGAPPSFSTALSDGDKRTLAFAFFIARLLKEPNLAEKIVVIDDPMCSLDRNRRAATLAELKKIHASAHQLIVLAHDPYFLRDLRDRVRKSDHNAATFELGLRATPMDYTDFAKASLDTECESEYVKNHRMLCEYATSNIGDPRTIAKTLRPLLEGYLHRRFPSLLPKDRMFGDVVAAIRNATPPSPLAHAQNIVQELNELNEYAGHFQHDTSQPPVAAELRDHVERTLCVIHKGAPR